MVTSEDIRESLVGLGLKTVPWHDGWELIDLRVDMCIRGIAVLELPVVGRVGPRL